MKKSHLLVCFLVLFFLFGCAEKTIVAGTQKTRDVQTAMLKLPCTFDADCPENKLCLAGFCETIKEFYSHHFGCCEQGVTVTIDDIDYSDCGFMSTLTDNMRDCAQIPCSNCKKGTQTCVVHPKNLENLPFYNYCADCLMDSNCKQGYSCIDKKCV